MTASAWLEVLDEALDACRTHGREDLVQRLRRRRDRPPGGTRIAVLGFPKQGKGYVVNAVLNAPVCAVGDAPTPAVPVEIGFSAQPTATLVGRADERVPVPVERLTGELGARPSGSLRRVEVGVPRELLSAGLVLVDTPAIGDPRSPRTAAALDVLADADAVVLVSDATTPLGPAEIALAHHVRTWVPHVVLALTKIDVCPSWRAVAERDRALLSNAGIDATVLPVSATVRLAAAKTGDQELNARSGFPQLLSWIAEQAARPPEHTNAVLAAMSVRAAAAELVEALRARAEIAAQEAGVDQTTLLQRAQRKADELRKRNTRWQNLLADEIADLQSDAEYDLRERTRKIVETIDETFDRGDPVKVWDEFGPWLDKTLSEAVETNYAFTADRAEWIARAVAIAFGEQYDLPELRLDSPGAELITDVRRPRVEGFKIGHKLFTGLRGSYGGVLMFGLVTSLAGLPLINPVSLGAGAAFAAKTISDESGMRLQRRQAVAKMTAQRHVDDVFLRFSKECRDAIRGVQRRLRDHFASLAEELSDQLAREREMIIAGSAERERRTVRLRREIERLASLHQRAGELGVLAGRAPKELPA
ncbi:isoniazid inducible protein IniA [Amycolatopsis sp. FDAARGOS 1241]|uniref:isoniazid inducible protein IniA n=1 Tax=Amycolatopsis sp. FDAARGOS 1241 TaxID=2778070 RepID=UPI0019507E53|nr:isoniazid inducible protein IniA [Amycolatopsis sp. FDAARGOS 1241]QRP44693.1 isoniazid inducible protein IniA [Amycolatopsis sp. FDAARGOS 1241]